MNRPLEALLLLILTLFHRMHTKLVALLKPLAYWVQSIAALLQLLVLKSPAHGISLALLIVEVPVYHVVMNALGSSSLAYSFPWSPDCTSKKSKTANVAPDCHRVGS
jgi:hypothetical protein